MTTHKWHDEPCPRCFIGRLEPKRAAFMSVLRQQLIVLPHTLAYTCDICGFQEFEEVAVELLNEWLSESQSNEVRPPKRKTREKVQKSQT